MPERILTSSADWLAALVAVTTAMLGGVISYGRRLEQGLQHSLVAAACHILASGSAGLIAWLACAALDVPAPMTAFTAGIAGHTGSEAIRLLENRFMQRTRSAR